MLLAEADGGTVTAGDTAMAFMPGSTASVLITDANSTFETLDDLVLGVWGQAQVQVANGGSLISDMAYIGGLYVDNISAQVDEVGYDPNGAGQVTVTGDDSSWDNTDTASWKTTCARPTPTCSTWRRHWPPWRGAASHSP